MKIDTVNTNELLLKGASLALVASLSLTMVGCSSEVEQEADNNVKANKPNIEQPVSNSAKVLNPDERKALVIEMDKTVDAAPKKLVEIENYQKEFGGAIVAYYNSNPEIVKQLNNDQISSIVNISSKLATFDLAADGELSGFWEEMLSTDAEKQQFEQEVVTAIEAEDYDGMIKYVEEYANKNEYSNPYNNMKAAIFFGTMRQPSYANDNPENFKRINEAFGKIKKGDKTISSTTDYSAPRTRA